MDRHEAYKYVKDLNNQLQAFKKLEDVLSVLANFEADLSKIEQSKANLVKQAEELAKQSREYEDERQAALARKEATIAELDQYYSAYKNQKDAELRTIEQRKQSVERQIEVMQEKNTKLMEQKRIEIDRLDRALRSKQESLSDIERQREELKARL